MGFLFKAVSGKEELESVFKLRYKVYCEEWGFERPEDHEGGIEKDEYDDHSLHFVALDETKQLIGTIRIILNSEKGFPIEKHCKIDADLSRVDRNRACEISRLAVCKEYRRRAEDRYIYEGVDEGIADINNSAYEKRRRQDIVIGLYKCIYLTSRKIGLTHWLAVMARGLHLLLRRLGVFMVPIGPEVDYHGKRSPYMADIAEMEAYVSRVNPDLFHEFSKELRQSFNISYTK